MVYLYKNLGNQWSLHWRTSNMSSEYFSPLNTPVWVQTREKNVIRERANDLSNKYNSIKKPTNQAINQRDKANLTWSNLRVFQVRTKAFFRVWNEIWRSKFCGLNKACMVEANPARCAIIIEKTEGSDDRMYADKIQTDSLHVSEYLAGPLPVAFHCLPNKSTVKMRTPWNETTGRRGRWGKKPQFALTTHTSPFRSPLPGPLSLRCLLTER